MGRPWWSPSEWLSRSGSDAVQGDAAQGEGAWPAAGDPRIVPAATLEEAIAAAQQRYGRQVRLVAARTMSRGFKGLLGQEHVEVLVAVGSRALGGSAGAGESGSYAFTTLEEMLDLADGADGVGRPIPMGHAYEQAYGHDADPRHEYDAVGYGHPDEDTYPEDSEADEPAQYEVSFDALVRQALDRVPSHSTRPPGRVSQLEHPAPEVMVDPVTAPRVRPVSIRPAPLAISAAPAVPLAVPKWSRRRLIAVGLPRQLAEALPLRAADDDAGWLEALAHVLGEAIESARASIGSAPAATASGRGGAGAIAIVKALALGVVPDEFDDGRGMRPASPETLAFAIRGLL